MLVGDEEKYSAYLRPPWKKKVPLYSYHSVLQSGTADVIQEKRAGQMGFT